MEEEQSSATSEKDSDCKSRTVADCPESQSVLAATGLDDSDMFFGETIILVNIARFCFVVIISMLLRSIGSQSISFILILFW